MPRSHPTEWFPNWKLFDQAKTWLDKKQIQKAVACHLKASRRGYLPSTWWLARHYECLGQTHTAYSFHYQLASRLSVSGPIDVAYSCFFVSECLRYGLGRVAHDPHLADRFIHKATQLLDVRGNPFWSSDLPRIQYHWFNYGTFEYKDDALRIANYYIETGGAVHNRNHPTVKRLGTFWKELINTF